MVTRRSQRVRGVAAVVALACLAVTAGCGDTAEAPERDDGLGVATYEPVGLGLAMDDPTLSGVLEDLDGCLVVRRTGAYAGEIYVPVFDVEAADLSSALLAVGTAVGLKGAWVDPGPDYTVPAACSSQDRLWRVSRS